EMRRLSSKGACIWDICKQFDLGEFYVRRILAGYDGRANEDLKQRRESRDRAICELREQGVSYKSICRQLNTNAVTIARAAKNGGLVARTREVLKGRNQSIYDEFQAGATLQKLSAKHGITKTRVSQIVHRIAKTLSQDLSKRKRVYQHLVL